MRVHTIDMILPLDETFLLIKAAIDKLYEIDENSYVDDLNLLIIGINMKDKSIIIRGYINELKNRFCCSILAFKNEQILKDPAFSRDSIDSRKTLGKKLYNLIKKSELNPKDFPFINLKIDFPNVRQLQIELIETEKEILMKILDSLREKYQIDDALSKFPFSLSDIDGSWEMWYEIYNPYIESIENKFVNIKDNSLKIYRNYDFAIENSYSQRIADLIIMEEEHSPISTLKSSGRTIKTLHERVQNQDLDKEEKNNSDLRISFIFSHKKKDPLRLIQMLKILGEVKNFSKIMFKKDFKHYNKIHSQIIFISLFGFEQIIGKYLNDNLYGSLSESQSIVIVPPIEENIWHNYYILNTREEHEYKRSQSEHSLTKYNKVRANFTINQIELRKMESQYNDIVESKKISEQNSQQLNDWLEILSVNNCSEILDVKNSRIKILNIMNNSP
ncbi:MAG: hypothetical protein ACFFKA_10440 [Candidatus Thorarchaeota archaeon]